MTTEILRTVERMPNVESRDKWFPGPWNDEPDLIEWRDPASGYPCLIVRNNFGALCGYVGVPPEHPLYGKGYNDVEADVHGGLTFANACHEGSVVCHVPRPGEPEHVWWFGFDCAHSGDLAPGLSMLVSMAGRFPRTGETYRAIEWVQGEVKSLAEQLYAQRTPPPLPGSPTREDE